MLALPRTRRAQHTKHGQGRQQALATDAAAQVHAPAQMHPGLGAHARPLKLALNCVGLLLLTPAAQDPQEGVKATPFVFSARLRPLRRSCLTQQGLGRHGPLASQIGFTNIQHAIWGLMC